MTIEHPAGAWADRIGALASEETNGLVPNRRTCIQDQPPQGVSTITLPLATDIAEGFYVKGDAGRLLFSTANADPDAPCDVQPDEIDTAICSDRVVRIFDLQVRRIENSWAGLRSFVPDGSPMVGSSDRVDGFWGLTRQRGYAIQTALALSKFAASAILKALVTQDVLRAGFTPCMVAVNRQHSQKPA